MVKRNTNFKRMYLTDNTLFNVINSKQHIPSKKPISYVDYQNHSCCECQNSALLGKTPFPEGLRNLDGQIDTTIRDRSSSSSDSSSDDGNGANHYNSGNPRMTQPSSYDDNIDTNYNSSNQRNTQPQSNGGNVYNSLNQRIINPLPYSSTNSSSSESDTENLNRNQHFQSLNSRTEYSPQISENSHSDDNLPQSNDINQENSNAYIANLNTTEMDISNQNEDITNGEEQFSAPLPDEQFMDLNVSKISQPHRYGDKWKKLKNKIRRKKEDAIRNSIKAITPVNDSRTSILHDERPLVKDEDEVMLSDIDEKPENIDAERKMRNKKDVSKLSRLRKQKRRKEKIKMLKLKQQRLKQLYFENKNQILENQQLQSDEKDILPPVRDKQSFANDKQSIADDNQLIDYANQSITDDMQSIAEDEQYSEGNDVQLEDTLKKPRISLRKFAYGTLPQQENITKPDIRIAKFANQNNLKNKENISKIDLQYLCELCKIKFPRYSALNQHLQENHGKNQYKIYFPDSGKYLALAKKVRQDNEQSRVLPQQESMTKQEIRVAKFANQENLQSKENVTNHGNEKYLNLTKKTRRDNSENNVFYDNFLSNNDKTVDLTSYWCAKCQKFFQNLKTMQEHMQEHENEAIAVKRSKTKEKLPNNPKKMFYEPY